MAANGNEAITLNQLKQFDSSGAGPTISADEVTVSITAEGVLSIKTSGVGTAQIADKSVTAAKLADGAITAQHLGDSVKDVSGGVASFETAWATIEDVAILRFDVDLATVQADQEMNLVHVWEFPDDVTMTEGYWDSANSKYYSEVNA